MQDSSFLTKGWFLGLCFAALAFLLMPGELFAAQAAAADAVQATEAADGAEKSKVGKLWESTGLKGFSEPGKTVVDENGVEKRSKHGIYKLVMILVGITLIYLGVAMSC